MNLFSLDSQSSLEFPAALAERYRPRQVADFIGLAKPKQIALALAARPFESGWTFVGPSGTGKTSLALALAAAIPCGDPSHPQPGMHPGPSERRFRKLPVRSDGRRQIPFDPCG